MLSFVDDVGLFFLKLWIPIWFLHIRVWNLEDKCELLTLSDEREDSHFLTSEIGVGHFTNLGTYTNQCFLFSKVTISTYE